MIPYVTNFICEETQRSADPQDLGKELPCYHTLYFRRALLEVDHFRIVSASVSVIIRILCARRYLRIPLDALAFLQGSLVTRFGIICNVSLPRLPEGFARVGGIMWDQGMRELVMVADFDITRSSHMHLIIKLAKAQVQ